MLDIVRGRLDELALLRLSPSWASEEQASYDELSRLERLLLGGWGRADSTSEHRRVPAS